MKEIQENNSHSINVEDGELLQDSVLDLLLIAYMFGSKDGEDAIRQMDELLALDSPANDPDKVKKAVYEKVAGKSWDERIKEDGVDWAKLIHTEPYRVYNTGVYDSAVSSGVPMDKTWRTMMDDKVRDAHAYLEGCTVDINDRFYTYNGDSALYPHGFGVPEEDINCRCFIELTGKL